MNTQEQAQGQGQTLQGLNVPLFNAFAQACNAAAAVEKAGVEAYGITVANIMAFAQYDNLAFAARASAVALAGSITKEAVHYSYLSRQRIALALSRLQAATAAAEDAARRAGIGIAPASVYAHDITAAQILDAVEYAWVIISTYNAAGENSGDARAKLAEMQGLITANLALDYNAPCIPGETAESFVAALKRAKAAFNVLFKGAQQALERVKRK